jgi:hypothetical protein
MTLSDIPPYELIELTESRDDGIEILMSYTLEKENDQKTYH